MPLIFSEKMDLFHRFKEKDIDKLRELSIVFKAHGNYEKARIADLLIQIKSRDIRGLKALQKELSRSGAVIEVEYVASLLEESLSEKKEAEKRAQEEKKQARLEKKKQAAEKEAPETSLGLSKEVYEAMATRTVLNSQRHRDRKMLGHLRYVKG